MLTIILILSLAACGNTTKDIASADGDQSKSEEKLPSENNVSDAVQYAQIGETVSTDRVDFVLQRFEFADTILYSYHDIISDKPPMDYYCLPVTREELQDLYDAGEKLNYTNCDEGYVFASMSFTIENTGASELKEYIDVSDGSTIGIYGYVELQFSKYLFRDDDISYFNDCTAGFQEYVEIGVMEPPHECRGYISVPEAVMNDTAEPLLLNVYLPNEAGEFETFTYQLR